MRSSSWLVQHSVWDTPEMTPNLPAAIRTTAVVTSVLYALVLTVIGEPPSQSARSIVAYIPAVLALLTVAFDKWMWRWPIIHSMVGRPLVHGTWAATLTPNADSRIPEGGDRGPISAAVIIEQSYWSTHVRLMSSQSTSESTSASLGKSNHGSQHVLTYAYVNEPKQQHRPRSNPFTGAAQFRVQGKSPTQLVGTYWTDRLTCGDMYLTLHNRKTDYATRDEALASTPLAPQS